MEWTLAQAKREFALGLIVSYDLERAILGAGWHLMLRTASDVGYLVDARDKSPRLFKSLDSAVSAVEAVGFGVNGLVPRSRVC